MCSLKWNPGSRKIPRKNAKFQILHSQPRSFPKWTFSQQTFHQRWACCNDNGKISSSHDLYGRFYPGFAHLHNGHCVLFFHFPLPLPIKQRTKLFLLAFSLFKCIRKVHYLYGGWAGGRTDIDLFTCIELQPHALLPFGGHPAGKQLGRKGPGGSSWTPTWPWASNVPLVHRRLMVSWDALGKV